MRTATCRASPTSTQSITRAKQLVPSLSGSADAREEFVRIVRAFMPQDANAEEQVVDDDLHTLEGDDLLRRLGRRRADEPAPAVNPTRGRRLASETSWAAR